MAKEIIKKKIDFKYNLSEYWNLLRNYKPIFIIVLLSVTIVELMQIIPKFLFKELVDKGTLFVDGTLGIEEISFILIVIATIYLLSSIVQVIGIWVKSHYIAILETKMMSDLKVKYFKHILSLDHSFHKSHKTGSLISRLGRGSNSIERITDTIFFSFLPLILQLTIVGISLAYFSLASAITIGFITLTFILFSLFFQKIQESSKLEANRAEDMEKGNVGDVFTNVDSIKYFGKEKLICKKFKDYVLNTERTGFKFWGYYRWADSGQIFILSVGTLLLLYFPMVKFLAGEITLGTIVFIYTIYGNIMGPMWGFVSGMRGFYRSMADFQDLFEYGKVKKEIKDKPGAEIMQIKRGEIEFKDVDFKYSKKKIFEKFNLKIPSKKKIALVGHSGCGKSTLVNLLYRLYDIDSGAITIDNKDIRDYKQENLRSEMSIVPQECVLFDDTIWNNIRFSNPRVSREKIWNAIRFSQLDKVINEMPDKEKTIVGERGVKLSGGEKQRVSIARALLADKKILVLDEATSALDSETEHEIQKYLAELMRGRTSIIIAHRLSTIMHADKIVVMKRGKIVQMGTHQQLIKQDGEYNILWNLQKGGYIK